MSELNQICSEPPSKRDADWERRLFESIQNSPLFLLEEEPFQGPDGFSYMNLSSKEGTEIQKEDFLNWSLHAGVGWVLNLKEAQAPDFVFNYGMVWNFLVRGTFVNEEKALPPESASPVLVHEIVSGYFPQEVRENMNNFLKANGIGEAEVTLISHGADTDYELLFYFPKDQGREEKDKKTLLEALSWFLPLNYNLAWAKARDPSLHFQKLA